MVTKQPTIGIPSLNRPGERRAFSPRFIEMLCELGYRVFLEEEYGSKMGYGLKEYSDIEGTSFTSRKEVFHKETVLSLIAPADSDLESMTKGQTLITMAHYETRIQRNKFLVGKGIETISLDELVAANGKRIVQDLKGTAYNGVFAALIELEKNIKEYGWPGDEFNVVLLGHGGVGRYAETAIIENYPVFFKNLNLVVPKLNLTILRSKDIKNGELPNYFNDTYVVHMLVDASKRKDPSQPIILYNHIKHMYEHGVILDLSVDPRLKYSRPGIQGIPLGNATKYVFVGDDIGWSDSKIPHNEQLAKEVRRNITAVSHSAWPSYGGITELRRNMDIYESQIYRIMEVLLGKGENPELKESIDNATLSHYLNTTES